MPTAPPPLVATKWVVDCPRARGALITRVAWRIRPIPPRVAPRRCRDPLARRSRGGCVGWLMQRRRVVRCCCHTPFAAYTCGSTGGIASMRTAPAPLWWWLNLFVFLLVASFALNMIDDENKDKYHNKNDNHRKYRQQEKEAATTNTKKENITMEVGSSSCCRLCGCLRLLV